jgi:hypothetical protein
VKIDFSQTHEQVPDLPDGTSGLIVADVELSSGSAKRVNKKRSNVAAT